MGKDTEKPALKPTTQEWAQGQRSQVRIPTIACKLLEYLNFLLTYSMGWGKHRRMTGFNVRKAAQVSAYFARFDGGSINVLKLVKLIYLADRRFLEKYDSAILNDRFVSMDHGPVNSITLNYINGCQDQREEWDRYIADRAGHEIALANPKMDIDDLDELSKAELGVLEEIAKKFSGWDGYRVRDYTHAHCPEWEDPDGSSKPLPYERVLKHLGKKRFGDIAEKIEEERQLDNFLATG